MLEKTRGIVMHTTDYSESSVVVKIFTEAFGMQSYLVNSVRKPKAKTKAGWLDRKSTRLNSSHSSVSRMPSSA